MAVFKPLFNQTFYGCNKLCILVSEILPQQGILKGGSITVPLTSRLTGSDKTVLQIKTKIDSCHTADSKPAKQEVNGTVILPPLVFPGLILAQTSSEVQVAPLG
jgi:hypothetical protein